MLLTTHYRTSLNFTFDALARAGGELARIDALHARLDEAPLPSGRDAGFDAKLKAIEGEIRSALADDLNVSGAAGALFRLVREANAALDRNELPRESAAELTGTLSRLDAVFGVIARKTPELLDPEIEALIASRQLARKAKNCPESDRIRDLLAAKGIVLEDTPSGVRWRRAAPAPSRARAGISIGNPARRSSRTPAALRRTMSGGAPRSTASLGCAEAG